MRVEAGQQVWIWTSLPRRGKALAEAGHQARIQHELTLRTGSSSAFTRDAVFVSERHPCGVVLSAEAYEAGCWVLLQALFSD
eukprot:1143390-Pleurochrysis_carterae.AAC.2